MSLNNMDRHDQQRLDTCRHAADACISLSISYACEPIENWGIQKAAVVHSCVLVHLV